MEFKIIFDRESINKEIRTGWGFSVLAEGKVLFDTGEKGIWLIENMEKLGVNFNNLKAVVISHDHWDHTGGLWDLLDRVPGLKVYVCPNFSGEFKRKVQDKGAKLVESREAEEIIPGIFSTGEISGRYKGRNMPEQALVVRTQKGDVVVTGCSHPGIVKILEKVKQLFPKDNIHFVFGGFHLMDKENREIKAIVGRFRELGVEKTGPAHCSGYPAQDIFREQYKNDFIFIKAGQEFKI